MNYFLPRNYYDNNKNYLSDTISPKSWRNIRKIHMNDVITYEHNGVIKYQCSKCGEFYTTLDLHDHWVYYDNVHYLDHFGNLCFLCHALEHLEKICTPDGKIRLDQYRGVDLKELVVKLRNHYNKIYDSDYDQDLKKLLFDVQTKISSGLIYKNDYSLINNLNLSYFKKDPIYFYEKFY